MNANTQRQRIAGPTGEIECAVDLPAGAVRGLAVICHPHPQFGGTMDNKVVQTIARACLQLGWRSVRFNFRGVGGSAGTWAEGIGEIDDAQAVVESCRAEGEAFLLAGFSFGAYIAAELHARLGSAAAAERLVLVGPSTQRQQMPPVPAGSIVIHGESDDVVPLAATLDWARPQSLPVIVFPGVGHFFHGQLGLLRTTIVQELQGRAAL